MPEIKKQGISDGFIDGTALNIYYKILSNHSIV